MTRARGELSPAEEALLGIERPSPEEEAEAERISSEKEELKREYFRVQMSNPIFRAWLWSHLVACGTFVNTFGISPTGFPQAEGSWFAAGRKSAGWDLWEFFDDLEPGMASLMRREAKQRKS